MNPIIHTICTYIEKPSILLQLYINNVIKSFKGLAVNIQSEPDPSAILTSIFINAGAKIFVSKFKPVVNVRNTIKCNLTDRISIKRFDPNTIIESPNIFITGPRCTGRSTLKRHLVSFLGHRNKFCNDSKAWSGTLSSLNDLKDMMPSHLNVKYSVQDFRNVIQTVNYKNINANDRRLFVLDDCTYDDKLFKQPETVILFQNGRQLKATTITSTGYDSLRPNHRNNIDYLFLARQNMPDMRERLYKNYVGSMMPKYMFDKLLDSCTEEDYNFLVLDFTKLSANISDFIFRFKADLNIDTSLVVN